MRGVSQRNIDDVDHQQVFLAGIKTAFEHAQLRNVLCGHTQGAGGELLQGLNGMRRELAVGLGFGGRIGGAAFFKRDGALGEFEF